MSGHSLITDLRQDKTEEGLQDKIYMSLFSLLLKFRSLSWHPQIRFPWSLLWTYTDSFPLVPQLFQLYQHFFHHRITEGSKKQKLLNNGWWTMMFAVDILGPLKTNSGDEFPGVIHYNRSNCTDHLDFHIVHFHPICFVSGLKQINKWFILAEHNKLCTHFTSLQSGCLHVISVTASSSGSVEELQLS